MKDSHPPLGISQVAMVVRDLEASLHAYHSKYGWGPWALYDYEPPHLHDMTVRGEPATFRWRGAETDLGPVWFELLQPVDREGVFAEWLAQHGETVHHLGYWAPTSDEADRIHSRLLEGGGKDLLDAWLGEMRFFYVETGAGVFEVFVGDLGSLEPAGRYPPRGV